MPAILLKKGSVQIKMDRSDLVNVTETANGVAFSLKGGIHILADDNDMPLPMKQFIRSGLDNFPTADVEVDLMNYKNPIKVSIQS